MRWGDSIVIVASTLMVLVGVALMLVGVEIQYCEIEVPYYSFRHVEPGNYTRVIVRDVWSSEIREVALRPGRAMALNFTLEEGSYLLEVFYVCNVSHPRPGQAVEIALYRLVEATWSPVWRGSARSAILESEEKGVLLAGKIGAVVELTPGRFKLVVKFPMEGVLREMHASLERREEITEIRYPALEISSESAYYRVVTGVTLWKLQLGLALSVLSLAATSIYAAVRVGRLCSEDSVGPRRI